MSQVAVFIAPIFNVRVSESLGRGERLDDSTFVTNDKDTVRSLISSRLAGQIGKLECANLLRADLVAYRRFSTDEFPRAPNEVEDQLALELTKLHNFLHRLWLVKDNAASVENGFIDSPNFVSSRIFSHICTWADGSSKLTEFSREEFRLARLLYTNQSIGWEALTHSDFERIRSREVVESEFAPFYRAMHFVGAARNNNQLSVKIANYCSALESLLVTSPTELTYRLCQRVGWLLGIDSESRIRLFEQLKIAYDFRSKAVHGSHVSAKKLANELIPSARICDKALREVIVRLEKDSVLRPYIVGETRDTEAFENRLLAITLGAELDEPNTDDEEV